MSTSNLDSQINLADFSVVLIGNETGVVSMSESQMKDCFKGKNHSWPNRKSVKIVLASSKHPKVELYSNLIYNKSFYSVKKYWYSLVFQGRSNPPYFIASDQQVIEFIAGNPGSIAIVQDSDLIPNHLRIQIKH
jgi:hypothetical protein